MGWRSFTTTTGALARKNSYGRGSQQQKNKDKDKPKHNAKGIIVGVHDRQP
jgi:hypothetical protein